MTYDDVRQVSTERAPLIAFRGDKLLIGAKLSLIIDEPIEIVH